MEAGSATFLDGTSSGCLSVTIVHADKVPMTPNFGQQPRFIVTIQPAGTRFDPPAPITFPNTDGLAPGAISDLYAFDHDLGRFVTFGTGAVSPDALTIASDPGVGVLKAGWVSQGDPITAISAENVNVTVRLEGQTLTGDMPTVYVPVVDPAIPDSGMIELVALGTPLPFGDPAYTWIIEDESIVTFAYKDTQLGSQADPNTAVLTGQPAGVHSPRPRIQKPVGEERAAADTAHRSRDEA